EGRGLGGSTGLSHLLLPNDKSTAYHMSVGRTNGGPATSNMMFPDIDFKELYYRFYVRQQEGWTGSGNNEKLLRITSFANSAQAQPFAMHFWAGNGTKDGTATGAYIGEQQHIYADPMTGVDIRGGEDAGTTLLTTKWNDMDNMLWRETGGNKLACPSIFSQGRNANNGKWFCIETRMKLNDPGVRNGIFEVWVDGVKTFSFTGYNFIGGWDPGAQADWVAINKIFLENHWNKADLIPAEGQWRDFDNLVLSTRPIGMAELIPVGSAEKIALRNAVTAEIGADFAVPVYRFNEEDYTPASFAEYKTALNNAVAVANNSAAAQTNVDTALATLKTKKAALARYAADALEKAEDTLFADDFTGDLSAYFENRGKLQNYVGCYGKNCFVSTVKQGNKAAGALTFAQNGNKAKTLGGAALALGFGKTPAGITSGTPDNAEVQSKVNIRFYTKSDENWSTGSGNGMLARLTSLTSAAESAMDVDAIITYTDNKLTVNLPGGKSIKSLSPIFDPAHAGLWYCVEFAIDTEAGTFELFINDVSQGMETEIEYPELTNGINALYLYNTVGELNIFDQNRCFDFLAITEGTYIGPVEIHRDGSLATPVPTPVPTPTPTPKPTKTPKATEETMTPGAEDTPAPGTAQPSTKPTSEPSPVCLLAGDVNGDCKVNIDDILLVCDVIFGIKELSPQGYQKLGLKANDRISIDQILFIRDVIFGA
ncbi:MAG: hypothetical protein FWD16_06940, partial [Clostridia bacterium]|nr:hypothetical protein [Clostridia bacterium]